MIFGAEEFQSTRPRGARLNSGIVFDQVICVSIHAPTGGATRSAAPPGSGTCFNPRAHGGATQRLSASTHDACFNPRAHGGRDPAGWSCCRSWRGFNPRAHGGRDLRRALAVQKFREFQSTRPRGARPGFSSSISTSSYVSIHAPTGGATKLSVYGVGYDKWFQSTRPRGARPTTPMAVQLTRLFQSTRPRGARHNSSCTASRLLCFNPRAHGGRDAEFGRLTPILCKVSIHAPTGGATLNELVKVCQGNSFNPRAHGGRDSSRPPSRTTSIGFNPRAHGGRDAFCHRFSVTS